MFDGLRLAVFDGFRLAVTTLTVLPVRAGRWDRPTAAVAMSLAPLVGAMLGVILAGVSEGLRALGSPALVAAAVTVAAGALLTRGLHLDGLADTVDALGSYRSGADALHIMKKSDIGPFGVAAIGLTLLIQSAALTEATALTVVTAWATGRLAITIACRRGVPPAREEGLGAMVASTVPLSVMLTAAVLVAALATAAIPGRPWQGPAAVAAASITVVLLVRHCVRRFGGITGDVLGAAAESATTVTLVALTLSHGYA
ncbi:putative cobalamin 5'-phosphate synthase [Actinoplanes missouriensis 431]|uniref:Adenosylcobinamide-GDP ribazoletransferase n=1 Tax=Actinoplanes missouriensis (strain ATCC 14538 / DSM 43046 / CBS 188.64 / JCM 3121 / NBRC 102363 / NCIMB 12654 / NRRL B-3342 / UNCC 431) TaxID=512565 RepID=I0H0S6_ACTM4|nr:adenosylcobinamide-GDP ribazoletransferase [Actinoplanes missouriensis]BAL86613.1 putative cobalamin 5'-phosphate synthase [Actinoplanes missouriensis 431]